MNEDSTSDPTAVRHPQGLPTEIQPQNIPDTVMNTVIDEAGMRAPFPMPEIPGLKPVSLLGHGGMGIVWLAEQRSTGRKVAVKLIRGGAAMAGGPMQRARFQREIELAARLEHPNIASVFDGGEIEDSPYCVMEYVEGRQLSDYAKEKAPGRDELIALMEKIADAVDHAHRRGVLHRDLKPGNIMVTDGGEPKLLDFGLARAMDGTHQTLTVEGALAGTPAYMSPEQARGEAGAIDTRSDIYSLGVIFYELLTRRHPYPVDGPLERVLANVSSAVVERPRAHDRSIPADLEMLLLHSLAAQPADRYASAGELAEDIRRFQRREPLLAGKTSTAYFVRKWAARNRAACLAGATLLATATGATAYHWRSIGIEKDAAVTAEKMAVEAMGQALLSAIEESMQRGNFKGALASIEKAEKSGSVDPGILLFHRIETMEALSDYGFVKLIARADRSKLKPEQAARLDYWRGERLLHDGKEEQAFALFRQALDSGDLPEVESALARAAMSDSLSEAIEHYKEAAKLAPWRAVTQRNLLWALLVAGRVDELKARLDMCYLLFPDNDSLFGTEAMMEAFRGNKDGALRIVARMKDDQSGWKDLLQGGVELLATFSNGIVNGFCGVVLRKEDALKSQLAAAKALVKVKLASKQNPSFAALSVTGPVIERSLGGIMDAILTVPLRDKKAAKDKIRLALEKSDDAVVWMLLAYTEMELGNFEEALSITQHARTLPSMFSKLHDASRGFEGWMEANVQPQDPDDISHLIRANQAFKDFYDTDVPKYSMRPLVMNVAIRVNDLLFARQVNATYPTGSYARAEYNVRIELAEGNIQKAIRLAEEARVRFPKNGNFQKLLREIREANPSEGVPADQK
jgi:tetratricopeptide (TPR) repeat protein/predicted Ser/Thr protein kinase